MNQQAKLTSFSSPSDISIDDGDTISTEVPIEDHIQKIRDDIFSLKQEIDSVAPCGELLIRIHKDLYEKPECFAVLSDDEIATVIAGIKKHTQRELIVGKERARLKKSFSHDDIDL